MSKLHVLFCKFAPNAFECMKSIMFDEKKAKESLCRNGFVVFDIDKSHTELPVLASMFGRVLPGDNGDIVQTLKAQERGNGSYGSFTYIVGYDSFPWHTDTAYWEIPTRYLMLTSDKSSPCATTIRTFDSLEKHIPDFTYLMERAVYLLDIAGKRKYLSPLMNKGANIGYRLDLHIYKPMNEEAQLLSSLVQDELNKKCDRVLWTGENVAVIDNWHVIHSRESAHQDKSRILKRLYINELV